jgi:nucleoside-diphosphate-sugar epimerase
VKRNFLIFGGSGFVGTHLSSYLESIGERFLIADLLEPIKKNLPFKITDVRERISLDTESYSDTIIVNLAAVHKTPGHASKEYFETNIKGAENVCDFARDKNINTIVFTSSIAVYGTYEEVKSEETLPMPDIPYGISKLSAEYIHKQWQAEDPLKRRLIILRPGVVFGQYEKGNFTRLINSLKGKYFAYVGRKETKKANIYVKDLVQVIYELSIDQSLSVETYNVSYNPSLRIQEIVSSVSALGEMKFPRIVIPTWLIMFLSGLMFYVLKKKDFHPERMNKLVISNNIDSKKINNKIEFNFGFINGISDWMSDTEFLRKNKYIK